MRGFKEFAYYDPARYSHHITLSLVHYKKMTNQPIKKIDYMRDYFMWKLYKLSCLFSK